MPCGCGSGCNSTVSIPTGSVGPTGAAGAAATVVVPNTVYVSTSGSDSGATIGLVERMDRPFLTIAAAITAGETLTPASTKRVNIVVFGGTYTENITLDTSYMTLMSAYESPLMYDDAGYATVISRFTTTKRPVHISGTITVTADFTNIIGINCLTLAQNVTGTNCQFSHIIASTSITTNNSAPAGSYFDVHSDIFLSLPSTGTLSGYYEKCTGSSTSFAGNASANAGNISGALIDCVGTTYSFASANGNTGGTISSSTFKRCKAIGAVSFASSNSGTAGTISGTLEDCYTNSATSFASSASGTGGTLSGNFIRCRSNSTNSFGSGVNGGTLSGIFKDSGSTSGKSFGSFTTTGGTLSGEFHRCYGEDNLAFGSTESGSGATLSGKFIDCTSVIAGFGCATTGTAATLSGEFFNCQDYDDDNATASFGSSVGGTAGVISGKLFNCRAAGGLAFCSSDTTGGTVSSTGQLINCTVIGDIMLRKAVVSGKIIGARIDSQTANEPGLIIAGSSTAVIAYCKIRGNGSATSIHAASAISGSITFTSTFGKGFHANVTNLVTTGYNIDDSNEVF